MSEDKIEEDPIVDLWYSNWEQQCVEAIEAEPNYENQLLSEKELCSQQIWTSFQTTASAISQLYKGSLLGFFFQFLTTTQKKSHVHVNNFSLSLKNSLSLFT